MTEPAHLLVIGDREPLAWVLVEQRMAFPVYRADDAAVLEPGDLLLLYTTRNCFHNPTRDRGRVVGEAVVVARARRLLKPVVFGGREYPIGCRLRIERLAARGNGVELAPPVPRLAAFPDAATWSARMRRPLVALPAADVALIREALAPHLVSRHAALPTYLHALPGRAA